MVGRVLIRTIGRTALPSMVQMEADQGRRLAGIEMADDGVADLPVELLKGVGLGVDGGSGCTGPKGAILRFLDHEKDFLHGAL
jgi:hypothetical protein